jgi:hypothetical protein
MPPSSAEGLLFDVCFPVAFLAMIEMTPRGIRAALSIRAV